VVVDGEAPEAGFGYVALASWEARVHKSRNLYRESFIEKTFSISGYRLGISDVKD
jgi:hypothetical protein